MFSVQVTSLSHEGGPHKWGPPLCEEEVTCLWGLPLCEREVTCIGNMIEFFLVKRQFHKT